MIKDSVRTSCYQRAILSNAHLFRDKVVLDVGSGTGILSFFAVQAGAKHVYGIECSEIITIAERLKRDNGFGDRITFLRGRAEEIELPVSSVDIIVSEWMGYCLLYEAMLDTVLFCRDKWLKKETGIILPDKAFLYLAAIEDAEYKEEKVGYWNNVYGLDFSYVKNCIMEEPIVDTVEESAVATTAARILVTAAAAAAAAARAAAAAAARAVAAARAAAGAGARAAAGQQRQQ
ncbi:arginine N-methyltransferase 1, putative [Eimeria brunetti]|uniref:type I protein arginine methyltransferase n=1 Tax=Eimeria brunetti TaxID=51314 RepID=U6LGD7_9EIME|nr:arginine N-methyltransferase 1, putative [Eimeria brunetti]